MNWNRAPLIETPVPGSTRRALLPPGRTEGSRIGDIVAALDLWTHLPRAIS